MGSSSFSEIIARAQIACGGFRRKKLRKVELLHRAAVGIIVVPLDDGSGEAGFILTRRAAGLRKHGGQFALPGGRIDPGETATEAVIRECGEELALKFCTEDVLGVLDDYPTRSGFAITPVVLSLTNEQAIVPNPAEVAQVHTIRLSEVTKEGAAQFITIPESDRPVIRFPLLGLHIYAPTAAIVFQFAELLRGRTTRVDGLEQPLFAWR